jgi:rhodanese-related sulfurtransferase
MQAETELRLLQDKRSPLPLVLGASVAAVLAIVGGAAWWRWRRRRTGTLPATVVAQGPELERVLPVVRVSAADLARAIAQRTDLVICDVRDPSAYEKSSVRAKGAIRTSPADILDVVSGFAREQGIVLYCASPNEAAGAEAARRLMADGFTRVAVLTGGFAAWEAASLPLERTPHGRVMASGIQPALPAPRAGASVQMDTEVDLPVGVKGAGPYFNARATRLGLAGLSLKGPEALTVGQRVRLTIFLAGEPLEVSGQVVAADSGSTDGKTCAAEVAFESLSEDHATALEGFILAQRTKR